MISTAAVVAVAVVIQRYSKHFVPAAVAVAAVDAETVQGRKQVLCVRSRSAAFFCKAAGTQRLIPWLQNMKNPHQSSTSTPRRRDLSGDRL